MHGLPDGRVGVLSKVHHAAVDGMISPHRRLAYATSSLDRIKAVKNELGVTVNDVVVTLCAAGLNITCMSYLDGVDVGIVADADQLDDAWPLVDGMKHALDELHAAVVGRSPAST